MIRFAVVGLGFIGKRHIEMIRRNPEAELVAVCDLIDYSKDYDVPFFQASYQMIDEIKPDVVCVCTHNSDHHTTATHALQKGANVLIEKPMALTKENADRILQVANYNKKQIFCVMQNRYSPPSQWIKSVIDEGLMGKIRIVSLNCYWNRGERYYKGGWKGDWIEDRGTLYTQFSHFIDIMYWLFGPVTDIHSRFADFNNLTDFEDSGIISFKIADGIGSINYSTAVHDTNLESSITIIGEKGTVKIGGQYMNHVDYCNIKDYICPELEPCNPANDYGHYKGSAANHHLVIGNVVDTLMGRAEPTTCGNQGAAVVEIIENIYKTRDEWRVREKVWTKMYELDGRD